MTMTTANELLDRCVEAARHGDCETVLRYLVSMREALAEAGPVCVVCGRPILPMIAAAAITVLPAPVVAVSENEEISRLSGFLKFSRARLRLARTSSTACSW